MALLPGTLFVYLTEALSSPRYNPKEAPQLESAQVLWVPLWRHDKAPMANKIRKQSRLYPGGFRPWVMHLI